MKAPFYAASLLAALIAMPASAQLGPAGVPGAPGLFTPPPQPQVQQPKRPSVNCAKAKNVEQCKARQEARQQALDACKDRKGAERKLCLQEQTQKVDCSKAREPARCEQHQKARELCKNTIDKEQYRQCLRDNLAPKK